jgi:hypothetical protein
MDVIFVKASADAAMPFDALEITLNLVSYPIEAAMTPGGRPKITAGWNTPPDPVSLEFGA